MNSSEALNELAKALALAQGEMGAAQKDAVNPFFKSHYADLGSIWRACKEPLHKHGLSVTQITTIVNDKTVLETILFHSSGQWIAGQYPINPLKPDPQSVGSAITYARRYALAAIVGVVTTDDDAEIAVGRSSQTTPATQPRAAQTTSAAHPEAVTKGRAPISAKQLGMLKGLFRDLDMNKEEVEAALKSHGTTVLETLTSWSASQLIGQYMDLRNRKAQEPPELEVPF